MTDYDRLWAEVYGDIQDYGPAHRHMVRLMRRLLAPLAYQTVLDVGVGFGHNLPVLTEGRQLARLSGIDIAQGAVDHVAERWSGDFHRLDISAGHLPDAFDLVCCALVLEHVQDDQAALRNLAAMTAGHLLVTTIGGDYERYLPWERQVGHVRNYAAGELENKLLAAGLEPVEVVRWGFPLYSPLVRRLQNRMTLRRELTPGSRLIARVLYPAYFLNSIRRGDLLLVLARPAVG